VWQVTLSATIPQGQTVNAWIQRDNAPVGYTTPARQSWFDDAGYDSFALSGDWQLEDNTSPVRRFGTLNAIATAEHLVVIGACQLRDGSQSLYSSAADGETMRTPDASAIADTSRHLPGILAAGVRAAAAPSRSVAPAWRPHMPHAGLPAKLPNPQAGPVSTLQHSFATWQCSTSTPCRLARLPRLAARALRPGRATPSPEPCMEWDKGQLTL
jgi:hypothetical protein